MIRHRMRTLPEQVKAVKKRSPVLWEGHKLPIYHKGRYYLVMVIREMANYEITGSDVDTSGGVRVAPASSKASR
jgi:hypothetical protein